MLVVAAQHAVLNMCVGVPILFMCCMLQQLPPFPLACCGIDVVLCSVYVSHEALTHSKLQLSRLILSSYRVFLAGITEFGNLELQKLLLGSTNTCSVHELMKF